MFNSDPGRPSESEVERPASPGYPRALGTQRSCHRISDCAPTDNRSRTDEVSADVERVDKHERPREPPIEDVAALARDHYRGVDAGIVDLCMDRAAPTERSGCAHASSGVTRARSTVGRVRNGPPDAVSKMRRMPAAWIDRA